MDDAERIYTITLGIHSERDTHQSHQHDITRTLVEFQPNKSAEEFEAIGGEIRSLVR